MIDRYMLRYFLAVVDHGTFTAAARHCQVSQPALSEGIAKLEQRLGRALLSRDNRRVEITAAGVGFAAHARRIEAEFLEAERAAYEANPTSRIRLGLASSLPPHWLEAALKSACREGVEQIELIEVRARDLVALLDRGRIDAAIGLRTGEHPPGRTLWTEGYGLALAATHRLAQHHIVTSEQVAAETMFVRRDCEVLTEVSRYFTSRGVRPFMSARTTSEERAIAYVRAGVGVTVMPLSFKVPGIEIIPLSGFGFTRSVGLLTDKLRPDIPSSAQPLRKMVAALCRVAAQAGLTSPMVDEE